MIENTYIMFELLFLSVFFFWLYLAIPFQQGLVAQVLVSLDIEHQLNTAVMKRICVLNHLVLLLSAS